jgi:hypothetical protein
MAAVHASWPSEAAGGATRHGARERQQWTGVDEAK